MSVELSVVVPVFNEEDVLPLLVQRLRPVLDGLHTTYEVVAVDDGSTDASSVVMQRIRHEWPQFRVIRLRANAGHQAAISAGLARARGQYMVTIDADLQDPPEVIAQMLTIARDEKVDVVYGVRNDRSTDTAFKRSTARAYYATMRAFAKTEAPMDAGDFRLMSRATVEAVNALPEHHRVLRLVVPALGFPSAQVTYKREQRAAGSTKYPLSKMIKLSIDSLTSHSMAPLRLATWFGLVGGVFALMIFAYALVSSFTGRAVAGWTSTVAAVSSVGAVQLICLGLLGEYVGRMYTMMQGRPTYFVAHDTDDPGIWEQSGSEAGAEVTGLGYDGHPDGTGPLETVAGYTPQTPAQTEPASPTVPAVPAATATPEVAPVTLVESAADRSLEPTSLAAEAALPAAETREATPQPPMPGTPEASAARLPLADGPRPEPRRVATAAAHGNGRAILDAELRQAVRRTSAKSVTPGSDFTGR